MTMTEHLEKSRVQTFMRDSTPTRMHFASATELSQGPSCHSFLGNVGKTTVYDSPLRSSTAIHPQNPPQVLRHLIHPLHRHAPPLHQLPNLHSPLLLNRIPQP